MSGSIQRGGSSQERGVALMMEAIRRGDVTGAAAARQGRRFHGRHGGGSGYESDDGSSSGGGVELSLRLRTGSSPPPAAAAAAEQQQEAAARRRRSMTIFYNGRVCAVDVTEIQAREIISMAANQEILDQRWQQQHREERYVQQDRCSSTTTTSSSATARCDSGQVRPAAAAAICPRQGLATMATDQAGLSMKRSLQRFLQKREARRAAAGGGRQAQAI